MDVTVLLVMDVQRSIVERFGEERRLPGAALGGDRGGARRGHPRGVRVRRFRPGHPEIGPRNATFSGLAATGAFTEGSPVAEIHSAVAPRPQDVRVTKRRVSAFAGSDLEVILRSLGAGTFVLTGIATSG
jgi:nicotinamidase-related amidase